MHGAALAFGIAAFAPVSSAMTPSGSMPRRQHVAVVAVAGDDAVLARFQLMLDADNHGFLPDIEVTEAADQTHTVELPSLFLEPADQQHVFVELGELRVVELLVGRSTFGGFSRRRGHRLRLCGSDIAQ